MNKIHSFFNRFVSTPITYHPYVHKKVYFKAYSKISLSLNFKWIKCTHFVIDLWVPQLHITLMHIKKCIKTYLKNTFAYLWVTTPSIYFILIWLELQSQIDKEWTYKKCSRIITTSNSPYPGNWPWTQNTLIDYTWFSTLWSQMPFQD